MESGDENQVEHEDQEPVATYTGPKITDIYLDLDDEQIETIWSSNNPKEDLVSLVKAALQISDEDAIVKERPKLETIAEFFLHAIIFVRDPENKIELEKATLLVRILATLLSPSNSQRIPERDFQEFKHLLLAHTKGHPQAQVEILSFDDVRRTVNFVRDGYFLHYRLYSHIFEVARPRKMKAMTFYIDEPAVLGSLSKADYKGEGDLEPVDEDDDFLGLKKMRAEAASREALKEEDEFEGLDEKTRAVIARKVEKMAQVMQLQLEERQQTLDTKFEEAQATASKKKKK